MSATYSAHPNLNRAVLQLALPTIAQSFFHTLFYLVDRAMLGHYSTDALAAFRLTSPLLWCISGLLSAFSIGSVALVGRAVGAGDRTLATATVRASLVFALGVGIAASGVSWLGLDRMLTLFPGVTPEVYDAANHFLKIILFALPFDLLATTAAAMLQAAGNSRTPFVVAGIANLVNLGIDYLLIYGRGGFPELGVAGAAIGSAIAMIFNAGWLLWVLSRPQGVLSFIDQGKALVWNAAERSALSRVMRVAFPTLGERLCRSIGYLGFTAIISSLGSTAMATHEALLGLEAICFLSADGFGIAVAAIVAQRLGAGKPEEAMRGVFAGMTMAIALLGCFALLFLAVPGGLLRIFTQDDQILAIGIPCLAIAALAQPFMATSLVLEQALRGAGATRSAFVIATLGWFVIRLIATSSFVWVLGWGLAGVWLGSTCDWLIRAFLLLVVLRRGTWQKAIV
ncbi:MATE family efflux transporter [Leptolyngbya sp. GB1-A1]|uniref:MATE family efflux transporter n=1 Tax=Leptolyngbya sp. GB1-A1 TaxID=2933908 RepID=UPI0032984BDD